MKKLNILFLTAILLSTCSCATATLTGALTGVAASERANSEKGAIILFATPVALPLAIAGDVVGTVFVGIDQGMRATDPEFRKREEPLMKGGLGEYFDFKRNFDRSYKRVKSK
jgi:hypothetical protein